VTPSFRQALPVWLKVGLLGFGGPAGQIALLHREVVDRRGWIDEARFQHALSFCMLLPGPEAQQLATYLGWLMHGVRGGLAAGLLFVLPGFALIVALSAAYVTLGQAPAFQAAMLGVKAAVVAIVLQAVVRVAKKSLKSRALALVAAFAFVAMALFEAPFPLVVLAAGLAGALLARGRGEGPAPAAPADWRATGRAVLVWGAAWLVPVALVALAFGPDSPVGRMGLFFSWTSVVTFGGAYAVLAYVAQAAVERFGWLSAGQMLDGLGLAETTPGPLILVLVFTAFVGAWQAAPEGWAWGWALAASTVTGWAIFAPSFLWIFAGAPHVERLRNAARLTGALRWVSAAVVGVIASLGWWFALRLLFAEQAPWGPFGWTGPALPSFRPAAAALVALAMVATFGLRLGVVWTILLCAAAGWALGAVGLA